MKARFTSLWLLMIVWLMSISFSWTQTYQAEKHQDAHGYTYEQVTNDPTQTRIYTLKNGLTVYLSRHTDKPRIQTYIAVRAGSTNDPADNTGLAHYLEHMMFKGTSKMGALDWQKEQAELKKISDLYEQHKTATDPEVRKQLYHQIDSISQIAAQYVAPNEYDRLTTAIGAQGTNAHTWVDETVYQNNIPANQLDRWLQIERERFGELVLRLFHTELEAVYEEFNMGQDDVGEQVSNTLNDALFPTHPYGQQTTIGKSEHLKSPSMEAIHRYWNTYYVPNNYAMILVGDLDYDKTIQMVDKYFGNIPARQLPAIQFPREKAITAPIERTISSQDAEYLAMAYRFDGGADTSDELYLTLLSLVLNNGQAGLIDLNLNQAQKVMNVDCYANVMKDYSVLSFYGEPTEGQTLQQVRDLILAEINKVKQGDFPDWLIPAVINNLELKETKKLISNDAMATEMYEAFIQRRPWLHQVLFIDKLKQITKQDLMNFVAKRMGHNYVIVYKAKGDNKDLVRVENPGITPLQMDRNAISPYGKQILSQQASSISPLFVDFDAAIKHTTIKGGEMAYIPNNDNKLFSLTYLFDMGTDHNPLLDLMASYFDYVGTAKLTPQQVKQAFYKLGISYSLAVTRDRLTITLTGLQQNMHDGVALLEDLLANAKPAQEPLDQMVGQILKNRADRLTDKRAIFLALREYVHYGEQSPLRSELSNAELQAVKAAQLTALLQQLTAYRHQVFYYGPDVEAARRAVDSYHRMGQQAYPAPRQFVEQPTGNHVYYADYDMVQAQMSMIRRVDKFDAKEEACMRMFNAYYGGSMASVVFQEIREAKSLAYSAYASYGGANKLGDYQYVNSFIGTQANKLPQAFEAMRALVDQLPLAQKSFEAAKESLLQSIESQRITRESIFWLAQRFQRFGITHNPTKQIYEEIKKLTLQDLVKFFDSKVRGHNYTYVLIGREADLPLDLMKQFGQVKKLTPAYLFNDR